MGAELKEDLNKINAYYLRLPQETKDRGVISFASIPPADEGFLTADLWDILGTSWRNKKFENIAPLSREANDKLVQHIKGFTDAPTLPSDQMPDPSEELDGLSMQRSVRRKRGSWYQVPKDLKNG